MFNLFMTLFSVDETFTCEHGDKWMAIDVVKIDATGYFILAIPLGKSCPLTPQVVYAPTANISNRGKKLIAAPAAEKADPNTAGNPDGGGLGHP